MQRDPGEPEPADEFDRIVAGWRRERSVPAWPDEPDEPDGGPRDGGPAEPAAPAGGAVRGQDPAAPDRPARRETDDDSPTTPRLPRAPAGPAPTDDGDHYVPPEPPPLPPVGPPFLVGAGLLLLGMVLIAVPWWIGIPDVYGLPLGLITLAAGLGWLVLRLWPDPPTRGGDGEDDGAVL